MSIETNPSWFSDFVEELGLPPSAAFQGYVLYNDEHDGFLAINQHADYPRTHYVTPSAWAHRYPYIQLASELLRRERDLRQGLLREREHDDRK